MRAPINMHAARTAMNNNPEVREWVDQWLRDRERQQQSAISDEDFEQHWKYVRPERMHEAAIEAVAAFYEQKESEQQGGK